MTDRQQADRANDDCTGIICLSHLKWERTLFQRPQQLMQQMSHRRKVLYVAVCGLREFLAALLRGRIRELYGRHNENLTYLNLPHLLFFSRLPLIGPLASWLTASALKALARRRGLGEATLWLYFPRFVESLKHFPHRQLVYDCMDFFEGFSSTDAGIRDDEQRLLRQADLVFTGGKSLQRAREGVNPRTYCFPSGVEFEHFHQAAQTATAIPEDIQRLPRPILGYFGAVDERIDFALLASVCRQRPQWSVVLLGPRIMQQPLPESLPNFHYLGKKDYGQLPHYLKAFDVCLMPFVISELTQRISPTKTPEYLAGGKPVVSTAIPDVVADYSDLVRIAQTPEEFIAMTEEALSASGSDTGAELQQQFQEKAKAKSWSWIADEMERLFDQQS